jgi:hypothetical protein
VGDFDFYFGRIPAGGDEKVNRGAVRKGHLARGNKCLNQPVLFLQKRNKILFFMDWGDFCRGLSLHPGTGLKEQDGQKSQTTGG